MTERKYSDEDTGIILRRAAELAAHRRTDSGGEYTLEELKEIGAEAGIPAVDIENAARLLATESESDGLFGPSPTPHFEVWLEGEISSDSFPEMIHLIRRCMGRQGRLEERPNGFDWSARSGGGGRYVSVLVSDGRTLVRCSGNFRDGATFSYLVGSGATVGASALLLDAVSSVATMGLLAVPVVGVAALVSGRFVWTRSAASETRRLRSAFEELLRFIGERT